MIKNTVGTFISKQLNYLRSCCYRRESAQHISCLDSLKSCSNDNSFILFRRCRASVFVYMSGRNMSIWGLRKAAEGVAIDVGKNWISERSHVSFHPSRQHHPAFPQWPLLARWRSGLQAESFTRCCSDYCNICNINSGAGHQHNKPNSHDNEVTVSSPDKMTMMFLSQCVDYVPSSVSHAARVCSG